MIGRNPNENSHIHYDAIIIGGGIYGIMLSLSAAKRGLKTLLLEKKDFGGETSYNHLKILHGGFRYLQNLDMVRFFESVGERKWFMQNFPGLLRSLPCLIPLYNKGIYRKSIFRAALKVNDILSYKRNQGLTEVYLPSGKIISAGEVQNLFPYVDKRNLRGGAIWYDCLMPDSQRILIELLKNACLLGARALNYCKAVNIIKSNEKVIGVEAVDQETGNVLRFTADKIINSAGAWVRDLASKFDRDFPDLFRPSLAWNVLFDKPALSECALAITAMRTKRKIYFLTPWKNHLLAGTIHEPWTGRSENPEPSQEAIKEFIADLNHAIPELNLHQEDILNIYAGLMPGKDKGETPAVRPVIIDHSKYNGPKGLFSISGVKFTTARLVAENTIMKIFPKNDLIKKQNNDNIIIDYEQQGIFDFNWYPENNDLNWKKKLDSIIKNESVVHLDDLILRRSSIGDNPIRAVKSALTIADIFNWDESRVTDEIARLQNSFLLPFSKLQKGFANENIGSGTSTFL